MRQTIRLLRKGNLAPTQFSKRCDPWPIWFVLHIILFPIEGKAQTSYTLSRSSDNVIADSLFATGNYIKAINYYAKAGNQNSGLQIARAYNAIGNYDKTIAQYKNVVEDNPDLQIARFELGKLLIKTKAYDEARKLFSKLVVATPDNPEYYCYQAEAYRELDQPASSLMAYKKAIEIDSTHLRSLFQLGKYFTIKQERNQALTYVDKGLRFYENDVALINLKALIYYNDNQYEKAIPWFEKVLELGEKKEYVYEKLAYCYYKNWEFEKAKETYRTLFGIDNQNSETYFGMASVFQKQEKLDSAEIFINRAMDVQRPIFAEGYSRLAGLAREREDLKTTFEYYKLAHREDPDDPMTYYHVCTTADRYYQDPKTKLAYYENFIERFGKLGIGKYMATTAKKRVSELKEEIHFAEN